MIGLKILSVLLHVYGMHFIIHQLTQNYQYSWYKGTGIDMEENESHMLFV